MPTQIELTNFHAAIPAAQAAQRKWGVPASVTLAQWIPESSWGQSQLATKANNYFGIKFEHLYGPDSYVEMPTAEYENGKRVIELQEFQKYPNAAASFDDHARLLATAPRYHLAMVSANLPEAFIVGLARGGYSTTADYADRLLKFMRLYNLTQYDVPPPASPAAQKEAA
ncbi:MAG TPA: glucosaminidase domain-containing protein [Acidobacteriaceae bacterium]